MDICGCVSVFSVPCRASTRLSYCFHILTKCFSYDICDTMVSQVTTWCGTPPQRFDFFLLLQICSRHMNKHTVTVVVKVSNTSLDALSVSKVSLCLWYISNICNGKSYPPLSYLHFEKVSFKIDFLFTESISALYQVSRTIIRDT